MFAVWIPKLKSNVILAAIVRVSEATKLRTEDIEVVVGEEETDLTSETAQTAVTDLVVGGESDEVVVIAAGISSQFDKWISSLTRKICRDQGGSRDRPKRGDVESEVMSLEAGEIAYLLGRNGATKQRLASFSGARLEIDPHGGMKLTSDHDFIRTYIHTAIPSFISQ
jgi:hypothetical protein